MRNRFKFFSISFSAILLISCGHRKDAVKTTSENVVEVAVVTEDIANEEISEFIDATVLDKSTAEGCDFVIQISNNDGAEQLLEPLDLDTKFKEDGLKVELRYRMSRRQSLCSLNSIPIIIDEIKLK